MVAKVAGIGEVTLFRWFSTKEQLYRRTLERAVDEINCGTNFQSRCDRTTTIIERASDWIRENHEPLQLLYAGLFDQPEIAGPLLRKCIDNFVNADADCTADASSDEASSDLKRKALVGAMLAIAANDRFLCRVFLNSESGPGPELSTIN